MYHINYIYKHKMNSFRRSWTLMQDRREYAKFEKERQKTVYALDENPLFRPATTRFRVPSMYKDD